NAVDILNHLGPSTTELQRARDIIGRQVHHLARMVDDLLDVSRIVTGKIELAREVFDLRVIVNEILDYHRPLCEEEGRRLVVSLPEAAVPIDADPARIAQVIANLLQNSFKFTHEGGTISLSLAAHDQEAVLEVADDGVGISPEMLERVFDLFAQADGERVDATYRGLGIGLTLVRRILDLHGGTVQARSEGRDRGSCFRVCLPLAAELSEKAGRRPGADSNDLPPPRRVLVVEDHVDTAEGLVMLLQMQGHEAVTAHDGPAALLRSEEFQPDAVLLDIGLPEMDGYEVARRIRERLGKDVLIVALTGFGQEEDRRRSFQAGIDHHLLKPVRSDVLAELLQSPRKPSSV
ncbi:MAG TPA: ATP-binding protein, partial [Thermoanaerobaculia bacterium]|nr:ATP-binding protein [Thermoanaerobaculia bacterium]